MKQGRHVGVFFWPPNGYIMYSRADWLTDGCRIVALGHHPSSPGISYKLHEVLILVAQSGVGRIVVFYSLAFVLARRIR